MTRYNITNKYINACVCSTDQILYLQTGSLLLSEVLHEGQIMGIKCQSFTPPRHTSCPELSEELHVNYKGVVCSLYGFALSNTLRTCRNQLARGGLPYYFFLK